MNRNATIGLVSIVFLVVAVCLGGVFLKKWRAKQTQEIQASMIFSLKVPARTNTDELIEYEKSVFLRDEAVMHVIKTHSLDSRWQLPQDEAIARVKAKFSMSLDSGQASGVKISYQDRDRDVAKTVLAGLIDAYSAVKTAEMVQ